MTGASGFIGKKLKERLLELNYEVVEFNSNNGDIADLNSLKNIDFNNVWHVFHLAAKTFVPDSWLKPEEYYKINAMGTLNILEMCKEHNISLTFISSYIYGQPEKLPISEEDKLKPNNPYAHSKFIAEQFCEFYAKQFKVNVTVIRPFNIYGIGQDKRFLIPLIIEQTINNDEIRIKDLLPKRDYVYLDDLVDALILTINKKGYSVYNIGSGYSISVKQVIDIIKKASNINKEVISEEIERKNEVLDVVADIKRAKKELKWYPKYSFEEGIKNIIDCELALNGNK